MQFWQTCRKIFAATLKSLCPKSKNKQTVQKICFQKTTLPNISPGHLKTLLTTQPDYFRQKPERFPQSLKTTEKFEDFAGKKKFLQKSHLNAKSAVLTTMSTYFLPTSKHFPSKLLVTVNFLEGNGNVMQENPLNECRKQFFKPGGRLSGGSLQSFSSKLEKLKIFFRKQTFLEKFCCSSRMHIWQLF